MQGLSTLSSCRTRSATVNTQEEATVGALPAKRGKTQQEVYTRNRGCWLGVETAKQICYLEMLSAPAIVRAVWDSLSWRNSSNAVTPTSGTPVSQGVDSPCTQQSTNANQHQRDGELLVILNMAR